MKLYDWECSTCDTRFEQFAENDVHAVPCTKGPCAGTAQRMLGGRPAHPASGEAEGGESPAPELGTAIEVEPGTVVRLPIPPLPTGTRVVLMGHSHDGTGCKSTMGLGTVVGHGRGEDA